MYRMLYSHLASKVRYISFQRNLQLKLQLKISLSSYFIFCEGTAYSKKLYICRMKGFLQFFVRVARFYVEGFQSMTWGRTLWILILVKLFVIFVVLRIFFFQPALSGMDEAEKQEAVGRALSQNP